MDTKFEIVDGHYLQPKAGAVIGSNGGRFFGYFVMCESENCVDEIAAAQADGIPFDEIDQNNIDRGFITITDARYLQPTKLGIQIRVWQAAPVQVGFDYWTTAEEWASLYPDREPITYTREDTDRGERTPNLFIYPEIESYGQLYIAQNPLEPATQSSLGLDYDEAQELNNNLVLQLRGYNLPEHERPLADHPINVYNADGTAVIAENTLTLATAFALINPRGDLDHDLRNPSNDLVQALAQPGTYRFEITLTKAVTTDAQGNVLTRDTYLRTVTLTVQEPPAPAAGANLRISWHFRDHLGTTVRTHSWSANGDRTNGTSVNFETQGLGTFALFEETVKEYSYEPFGDLAFALNAGDEPTNPRYTDHERDAFTGLNYMKGRGRPVGGSSASTPRRPHKIQPPRPPTRLGLAKPILPKPLPIR